MEIEKYNLYWLAGLLEAEGSFLPGPPSDPHVPRIRIQMTDEDIIARVAGLFEVKHHETPLKNDRFKTPHTASLKGTRAALLMQQLYPLMSQRRQAQIELALHGYNFTPRNKGEKHGNSKLIDSEVREIKRLLVKGVSSQHLIAEQFGVKPRTISDIQTGKSWTHITLD